MAGGAWLVTRLLADVGPLRESPPFRRLWAGSSLSSVGGAMTTFAVALQVFQLTGSSAAVGAIGLTQAVVLITLGPLGGSLADGFDRRRLALVTSSALAGVSALFAAQAFGNVRQLWPLFVLITAQASLAAVDGPARRVFTPLLLPPERVGAGMALTTLSAQVARLVGPMAAGVLVAEVGLRACYLVDAASFAGAIYGLARLPATAPARGAGRAGLRSAAQGLRFVRRQPVLLGALLTDVNGMVLGMPVALLPAFAAAHFGGSPRALGLLVAAPAVGGLIGASLSGPVGRVRRPGRALLGSVALWGLGIAAFGFATALWLAVGLLALAGAADAATVVLRGTIVQLVTPDELRGRVTSLDYVVGVGSAQLGNFRAGAIASLTSPAVSAVSGGLATVAGGAVIALSLPALRRFTHRPEGRPSADGDGDGGGRKPPAVRSDRRVRTPDAT